MKEIHSQLCPVKRQKTLANAEAEKLKRLATSRVVTQVQSTQTASNAGPKAAAEVLPAAGASAAAAGPSGGGGGVPIKSGNTTISLARTMLQPKGQSTWGSSQRGSLLGNSRELRCGDHMMLPASWEYGEPMSVWILTYAFPTAPALMPAL
jgi:hypothetical protein